MQFQFLRLAKLFPAEVAERPRAPGVGGAAVSAVHVEVVEAKEVLKEGRKEGGFQNHFNKIQLTGRLKLRQADNDFTVGNQLHSINP